jgi:hypothetical protein
VLEHVADPDGIALGVGDVATGPDQPHDSAGASVSLADGVERADRAVRRTIGWW